MLVKFKKRRRIFIKVVGAIVTVFFFASMLNTFQEEKNLLTFISLLLQVLFWFGLYYYQAVRYDEEKIIAQFGWPRIYYKDIISIKSKWDDIIIKSNKRDISISRNLVDEESLKTFIEHLDQNTPKPIDTSILL